MSNKIKFKSKIKHIHKQGQSEIIQKKRSKKCTQN